MWKIDKTYPFLLGGRNRKAFAPVFQDYQRMRKANEEFNSETMIGNTGWLCGQELAELPYWETMGQAVGKGVTELGVQGCMSSWELRAVLTKA